MPAVYRLEKSKLKSKKWTIITPSGKKINFGAKGYSDYTIHKDSDRKERYISRHKSQENWKKSGINTAGFWARWLLWNQPTLEGSIRSTSKKFNIRISKKR